MRIVVNCRSILLSNRTGIGRYTYNLIDQLGKMDASNDYMLYAQKKRFDFKRKLPRFNYPNFHRVIHHSSRPLPWGDLYHLPSPADIESFNGKVVVTIHDMIYRTYPQSHTQETIDLTEKYMQGIVARADRIICVSESTRSDLHRFFEFPKERSCVVHNGVDHDIFHALKDLSQAKNFLKTKNIQGDFLLFVGTIEPRKNLLGLVHAMAESKTKVPLVVVGMQGWKSDDVAAKIKEMGLESQVIFTGFISDQELNFLYNTCTAFVFPSFYEGFGFPIIEAFAAGACVVSSSLSSCGEIAKDAALLIDPNDPSTIASMLQRILGDSDLRASYKSKALKRALDFSFEKTARETHEVYKKVVT